MEYNILIIETTGGGRMLKAEVMMFFSLQLDISSTYLFDGCLFFPSFRNAFDTKYCPKWNHVVNEQGRLPAHTKESWNFTS